MGISDFFRRKPEEEAVVFAGDRLEAGLVMGLLMEGGYHPREWMDMPAPACAGPAGMARIVVPSREAEAAREFLASLRDEHFEE